MNTTQMVSKKNIKAKPEYIHKINYHKINIQENLYQEKLSLNEELPRLATQSRLLFRGQSFFIPKISLPAPTGRFIDFGSGPGIHLSLVKQLFPGYAFTGLEISTEMLEYAKLNDDKICWVLGDIYNPPFGDNEFEIGQASFIFIHLRNPELALRQIYRVLKPGAILVILDVDDSTFQGFSSMKDLIKNHQAILETDRMIMSKMQSLAKKNGFELILQQDVVVNNHGQDDDPKFDYPHVSLGRMTSWGMFAFMGQRPEVAESYQKAHKEYMSNPLASIEISIVFQAYRVIK